MTPAETNVRLLLAVAVVILVVKAVGRLGARVGQPAVIGEVVAGILLGPSLLGLVAPAASAAVFPPQVVAGMQVLAQFGLVLFMLVVGMHLDVASVRGNGRAVAAVAPASIAVPFVLAAGLGVLVHPWLGGGTPLVPFALFLGAAMSVTALPVLARLLVEMGLSEHRLGGISLASAAVNDVAAWCLVAVVAALNGATGPAQVAGTVGLAVAFLAVMLLLVRPLLARLPDLPVWALIVGTLASAWTAEQIGIHAIIGAFVAGVVVPRRPAWMRVMHERLDVVVRVLLLPIFFVVAGLAARVDQLTVAELGLTAGVVALAVVGKLGGTALAARAVGETWHDATTLGLLMNTRGVTELVILALGLQLGVISTTVYTIMVLMALVTTLMAAPLTTLVRRGRAEPAPVPDELPV